MTRASAWPRLIRATKRRPPPAFLQRLRMVAQQRRVRETQERLLAMPVEQRRTWIRENVPGAAEAIDAAEQDILRRVPTGTAQ